MTHMTLIRHGQANASATDEAGYDQLSDLGHQQAKWLGEHFEQAGQHFSRIYSGTMKRHIQTAEGLGATRFGSLTQDARLNEFPYYSLRAAYERQFGAVDPQSQEDFAILLCELLERWEANQLDDVSESYVGFFQRVAEVMDDIAAGGGPALVVTSGGFISTAMRHSLGFDLRSWTQTCLATLNTSVHTWQPIAGRRHVTQFNAVPHLDAAERREAMTYI